MEPRAASEGAPLCLGPGPRLARLAPLVQSLGGALDEPLDELGELGERAPACLLLDADLLREEELGFVQRHLAHHPGARLVLTGDEVSRRGLRRLLRHDAVRFVPWPLDLEDLELLAGGVPAQAPAPVPQRASARTAPSPARAAPASDGGRDAELAEIERILGAPAAAGDTPPPDEPSEEEELEDALAFDRVEPPAPPAAAVLGETPSLEPPPPYFKDQVADLADIAQRIQLALEGAREEAVAGELAEVEQEVERLLQFTRTLGFLVAPPGPGHQTFDLTEMVEVFLGSATSKGPDAPRCLFRGGGPLPVRSDRALLGQALDAFLFLAQGCAERDEIVRVQTRADGESCVLVIEFPAGPLAELEPERILVPYGLRRWFPKLGPNALAAATGIVAGQGGRVLLGRAPGGRLAWTLELPRARSAGRG